MTEVNEERGRAPRAQTVAADRRRRRSGTLDRMTQYRLDCIPPEALDLKNYVYRWIDDRPGRLHMATKLDDYDFVKENDLGGAWSSYEADGESDDRVRMIAEANAQGKPVHTYLCRKPREFWEQDQEEIVAKREAMMEGRIYSGEGGYSAEGGPSGADLDPSVSYVPKGVQMGGPAARKRGPVRAQF